MKVICDAMLLESGEGGSESIVVEPEKIASEVYAVRFVDISGRVIKLATNAVK